MLDFAIQMRFFKSASDAYFEGVSTAMAAAAVWQDEALAHAGYAEAKPAPVPFNPFDPMSWWQPPAAPKPSFFGMASAPFGTSAAPWNAFQWPMPFLFPWATAGGFGMPSAFPNMFPTSFPTAFSASFPTSFPGSTSPMMPNPWAAFDAGAMAPMMQMMSMWSPLSWTMWQMPITAMMMSAGMPYSVACPAARASTASLDAMDAARDQVLHVFSAYRTDGGHAAAAKSIWP